MNTFHDLASSVGKPEQQEAAMRINFFYILWFLCTVPSIFWLACGHNGFWSCIFWGAFIGFMTAGTLVSCFGKIWIGWHASEIIDEVCDGLLGRKK
jgi:hypothetical protein